MFLLAVRHDSLPFFFQMAMAKHLGVFFLFLDEDEVSLMTVASNTLTSWAWQAQRGILQISEAGSFTWRWRCF